MSSGYGRTFDPLAEIVACTRRRMSPAAFWARARGLDGECWPWPGRMGHDGYGRLSWAGRTVMAHRLACALAHGPIPPGSVVMHSCDNPPCVNPAHLSVGSINANNLDMLAKGRGRAPSPELNRGTRNVNAKLDDDLVRELRAAWASGESIKSIAARMGMATGTLHPMLHGVTWRHVSSGGGST